MSMLALLIIAGSSCSRQKLLSTGGVVKFSADTLLFDTVFTAEGSFTLSVKIYNPQDEKIVLSSVRLANGSASQFHINVDGAPGNNVTNVTIAAHDSAYVFATVDINPTSANSPFVVEDNLVATLNGKEFSMPFIALGQNAHYIIDSLLETQTWLTDRPYVIIHSAEVVAGQTLTIPAGCKVYMHADSRLIVEGTLKINGTKTDSVIFQGDRLDRNYFGYEGYPGEWGGLYFDSRSTANELHYAVIRDCGNSALNAPPVAIQVNMDSVHGPLPQLYMDKTIIENSIGYGLLSFGGTIHADNCLIHDCGAEALALVQGGNDTLNNCTIAVYGSDKINHSDNPTAILLNYYDTSQTQSIYGALNAVLRNCIIYGSLTDELIIARKDSVHTPCNVVLDHCLVKAASGDIPAFVQQINVQTNADPLFVNTVKWDFHLKSGSPAIGAGIYVPLSNLQLDLDGIMRTAPFDIGCFKYH